MLDYSYEIIFQIIGLIEAPKSLLAKDITESTVTLEWVEPDESENLKYVIEGKKETETEFKVVTKTSKPSAIIQNLSPSEKYIFQVKSVDENVISENAATLQEPICMKPVIKEIQEIKEVVQIVEPPKNLRLIETKSTELTIEWDKPKVLDKIESFVVQFKKEGEEKWKEGVSVDPQNSSSQLKNVIDINLKYSLKINFLSYF